MMASDHWRAIGERVAGYRIDAVGDSDVNDVWLSHDPEQRLELSDVERQTMDERWAVRLSTGQRLKDLPLYRLLGWQADGSQLVLSTGLTSYKEFLGTEADRGAAPLALSVVTVTSDDRVVLNQRSTAVAELPGLWHVTPAGHPHPPASIEGAALAELSEELAVDASEVVDGSLRATGLVVNVTTRKPEVTLVLRLSLTVDEVLGRKAIDAWEYTRLKPIEWSAAAIERWLRENVDSSVPVGHAALLLAGHVEFGEAWFDGVRRSFSA